MKNRVLKYILIIILSILVLGGFVGNYFVNFALSNKVDKTKVNNQDKDGLKDKDKEKNQRWFDENAIEVKMKSKYTGNDLVGYQFLSKNTNKWVIVVHGFGENARHMATYIKNFYDRGYSVFAQDLNAHGKSSGEYYTMGGFDGKDLKDWVNLISKEYDNPDIVLFGISMGAATVMNSLDEDLPNNVKAFIEDSGYLSLNEEFSYQLKKLFNLPPILVLPEASIVAKIKAGYFLKDVDATKGLENTTLPALILHGDKDGFVPVSHAEKIYSKINSKKEIYIFKDAKHVRAERMYKKEYWEYIDKFLEKYFK